MLNVIFFIYKIGSNHGNKIRNETTGSTPEYEKTVNYFDTDDDFLSWHGFITDYLHALQILSAVEISNDGSLYNPLEANLKDVSTRSIANKYIETTLDISK